jgi:hypothetical protein
MMRHPGGVAIGSVGAQPARNTRHPVSACLPCLDLPCPPVLPKPPKTPQSSTTLNRGLQVGTDTSFLYHLLRVRPVALPFPSSSNPTTTIEPVRRLAINLSIAAQAHHHYTLATLLLVQLAT